MKFHSFIKNFCLMIDYLIINIRKFFIKSRIVFTKRSWFISKRGNLYNPILEATVYRYGSTWRIARHGVFFGAFEREEDAMDETFQIWLKDKKIAKIAETLEDEIKNIKHEIRNGLTKAALNDWLQKSAASTKWQAVEENEILDELKSREPIFHHPEKYGKTKEDIEAQICEEFWEVGASGKVYTKENVIETLLERYKDPDYQDVWEVKEFELAKIAQDHYLLTYILIQNKTRLTRRSTIWRRISGNWKILYHQGTVIEGEKTG
ncbi:MAG: DUF4440 domain-containing protein [Holosporales bacterium]